MTRRTNLELELSKARPKNAADFGQFGNAAAMRDALEKISLLSSTPPPHWKPIAVIVEIGKLADAALSAPPRNCDVGTAEEQTKRFRRFCDNTKCQYCNITVNKASCSFNWAQTPYEEGGAM